MEQAQLVRRHSESPRGLDTTYKAAMSMKFSRRGKTKKINMHLRLRVRSRVLPQDVLQLHVPVNDVVLVAVANCVHDFSHVRGCLSVVVAVFSEKKKEKKNGCKQQGGWLREIKYVLGD